MKKLIKFRNPILFTELGITLVMLLIYLIFGDSQTKIAATVYSLVLPLAVYFFISVVLSIIYKNASQKAFLIFSYFFLAGAALGFLLIVIPYFIAEFPNGYSSAATAIFGAVMAIIDSGAKFLKS